MEMSASKIWNYSNSTKTIFNKEKNSLTLLFPTMVNWIIETMNLSDEVWMWVHQKYGMGRIVKKYIQSKETIAPTLLFSTMVDWIDKKMDMIYEVWMSVNQNMEWLKLYKHCIQLKQTIALT